MGEPNREIESEADYDTGYGKPPRHSQFKPGQSGNPRGRPKGTKNLKTDLKEELREIVALREGDRVVRCSKQRAIVKRLTNEGAKGDMRAIGLLIALINGCDEDGADARRTEPLSPEDKEVLRGIAERLTGKSLYHDKGDEPKSEVAS